MCVAGLNVSEKTQKAVLMRYGDRNGNISFNDFVACYVKLKTMLSMCCQGLGIAFVLIMVVICSSAVKMFCSLLWLDKRQNHISCRHLFSCLRHLLCLHAYIFKEMNCIKCSHTVVSRMVTFPDGFFPESHFPDGHFPG